MNQDLLDKVVKSPRLPSLPAVALRVVELCRHDETTLEEIANLISQDPALAGKILRTVNSSFYGLARPVSTVSQALVILGLHGVRTLALSFSLVDSFRDAGGDAFDSDLIWRKSLYTAVASRAIARAVGLSAHEEAFLGGLLQDIGVLAMIQALGGEYVQLLRSVEEAAGEEGRGLFDVERERYGFDHTEVGEALASGWKLPAVLAAPVRYHEQPEAAPEEVRPMVHAVTLGGRAAEVYLHEDSHTALREYLETARRWFGLEADTATQLLRAIAEATKELSGLFRIPVGGANDVNSILADANELLLELSLQTAQTANVLEAENRELQQKVRHDPLTGVGNRGHFNTSLQWFFEQAAKQSQPVSLVMLDIDKFKPVNDTHGHLAGDRALIVLAKLLQDSAPPTAEVCRYGGEEFAILMPGTARPDAARIAEHIRCCIEGVEIAVSEQQQVRLTASLGVATFDGVRFFRRPEQLIKAADQAVYAAKNAGRNCVRIFAPRERRADEAASANAEA